MTLGKVCFEPKVVLCQIQRNLVHHLMQHESSQTITKPTDALEKKQKKPSTIVHDAV